MDDWADAEVPLLRAGRSLWIKEILSNLDRIKLRRTWLRLRPSFYREEVNFHSDSPHHSNAHHKRQNARAISDRTDYGLNPEKTNDGELTSAYACAPRSFVSEVLISKKQYKAFTGKDEKSDVLVYQVR